MKIKRILLILFIVLACGCSALRHEQDREIQKNVKRYLDAHFDSYIAEYNGRKIEAYKRRLTWGLGIVGGTLSIVATTGGLILLVRKIKSKNGDN